MSAEDDAGAAGSRPGNKDSFRDRRRTSRDRWRAMQGVIERQHPELAKIRSEYAGWLAHFLDVDPATGTADGIRVEDPASGVEIRWEPGRRYIVRQVPEAAGDWCSWREAADRLPGLPPPASPDGLDGLPLGRLAIHAPHQTIAVQSAVAQSPRRG